MGPAQGLLAPAPGFNAPPIVRWVPKKRGFRPIVKIAKWADQGKLGAKQKAPPAGFIFFDVWFFLCFSAVFRPVLFCSFLLLCLFFLILVFHPNKSNRWGEDPQLTKLFYNF